MSSPLSRYVPQPSLRESVVALSDPVRWPQGSLVALLADSERAALLSAGTAVKFDDDDVLVRQGEFGDGLYVLTGGMVKVTVPA